MYTCISPWYCTMYIVPCTRMMGIHCRVIVFALSFVITGHAAVCTCMCIVLHHFNGSSYTKMYAHTATSHLRNFFCYVERMWHTHTYTALGHLVHACELFILLSDFFLSSLFLFSVPPTFSFSLFPLHETSPLLQDVYNSIT